MATNFLLIFTFFLLTLCSIKADIDESKTQAQDSGMEFSFFHRDSEFSPIKRDGMSHSKNMIQYLSEDRIRISEMNQKIKEAVFAKKNRGLIKSQRKISLDVNGSSAVYTIGAYILSMNIGTPPQNQFLLFSTSTEFSWVQCAGCTKCYKQLSAAYAPTKSTSSSFKSCKTSDDCGISEFPTTCSSSTCGFEQTYSQNQKVSGKLVLDVFRFNQYGQKNTVSSPKIYFGCGSSSTGYSSFADGVASFGRGSSSIPNQMAKFLGRSAFSSCLVPYSKNSVSKIVVGPAAIPKSGVTYTPLINTKSLTEYSFYYVNLIGVKVGSKTLSIPSSAWKIGSDGTGGTILDVGTTYIFLVTSAYDAIMKEVKTQVSKKLKVIKYSGGYKLCFSLKQNLDSLKTNFPQITFLFSGGASVTLEGYHYVDQFPPSFSCVTFQKNPELNILGMLFHQNLLVVYDISKSRIGFQSTDCTQTI